METYKDLRSKKAIYIRVSTQSKQEGGICSQRLKALNYCKAKGFKEDEIIIYTDKISGAKTHKAEALAQLLEDCRNGKVDTIVINSISRLSRSLSHLISVTSELNSLSVTLLSIAEEIDFSSHTGKMLLAITGSIAQWEREAISLRCKRGIEYARASGKQIGKPRTVDYELVITLYKQGLSYRKISKASKTSISNCHRIIKKYKNGELKQVPHED